MSSFIQNSSIIDLYADDSTVHESGYDVKLIESNLQSSIDRLTLWCTINKMSINPLKNKMHAYRFKPPTKTFAKTNTKCRKSFY